MRGVLLCCLQAAPVSVLEGRSLARSVVAVLSLWNIMVLSIACQMVSGGQAAMWAFLALAVPCSCHYH